MREEDYNYFWGLWEEEKEEMFKKGVRSFGALLPGNFMKQSNEMGDVIGNGETSLTGSPNKEIVKFGIDRDFLHLDLKTQKGICF